MAMPYPGCAPSKGRAPSAARAQVGATREYSSEDLRQMPPLISMRHARRPKTSRSQLTSRHQSPYRPGYTTSICYGRGPGYVLPTSRHMTESYRSMNYPYHSQTRTDSKDMIELEAPLTSTQIHVNTLYPYAYGAMYPYFIPSRDMYQLNATSKTSGVQKHLRQTHSEETDARSNTSAPYRYKQFFSEHNTFNPIHLGPSDSMRDTTVSKGQCSVHTNHLATQLPVVPPSIQCEQLHSPFIPSSHIPQWYDTVPHIKDKTNSIGTFSKSLDSTSNEAQKLITKSYPDTYPPLMAHKPPTIKSHKTVDTDRKSSLETSRVSVNHAPVPIEYETVSDPSDDEEDFSIQMALGPSESKKLPNVNRKSVVEMNSLQNDYSCTESDATSAETLDSDYPMPPLIPLVVRSRPTSNKSTGSNVVPTSESECDENENPSSTDFTQMNIHEIFNFSEDVLKSSCYDVGMSSCPITKEREQCGAYPQPEFLHIMTEVHNCGKTIDILLLKFQSQHFTKEILALIDKFTETVGALWRDYNIKINAITSVVKMFEVNTDFIQDYLRLIMEYRSFLMRHYLAVENSHGAQASTHKRKHPEEQLCVVMPNFSSSSWKFYSNNSVSKRQSISPPNEVLPPRKRRRYMPDIGTRKEYQYHNSNQPPDKTTLSRVAMTKIEENNNVPAKPIHMQSTSQKCTMESQNGCMESKNGSIESQDGIAEKQAGKDCTKQANASKGSSYVIEQLALMDKQGSVPISKQILLELSGKSGLPVKTIKRLYSANMVKNMCSKRSELSQAISHSSLSFSDVN